MPRAFGVRVPGMRSRCVLRNGDPGAGQSMQNTDHWSHHADGATPGQCTRVKVVTRGLALALLALGVGLYQWDTDRSSRVTAYATCDGFESFVRTLSTSAEGRTVLACSYDGKLTAWEAGFAPVELAVCSNSAPGIRP